MMSHIGTLKELQSKIRKIMMSLNQIYFHNDDDDENGDNNDDD